MSNALAGSRPAEILLVEDNDDDVLLTREAFRESRLTVNLHHVENGEACLAFLRKQGPFAGAATPDLILLDLNMPVMDGREALAEIVHDDDLKHLCVVILTTASEEKEVLKMYQLRCSSYIIKPVDFDDFRRAIRQITDYWFTIVVLPKHRSGN